MARVSSALSSVSGYSKYVFSIESIRKLQSEEMNKVALLLVFLCGVIFAVLVSVLRNSWTSGKSSRSLGAIPAGSDLELMDDGYVAMAMLDAHEDDHAVSKKQTTELEDRHVEIEALNTLQAAKELVHSGKSVRAGRLLEHALSIAPRHPDILVYYGEYLEQHRNDVVEADKMYLRALAISPANSRALRNRRRTRPLVEEMDAVLLSRIDGKRDDLQKIPNSSSSLRRIKKEAYYQYIYHTAGIEGNTMTLSQTRMILETRLSVGGKSVMEHNEILGLDMALKYINTTLVHRIGRISLHDILEIHRRVLGHVDPLEAGHLRTTQVYVSNHVPPPPTHLELLMEDFVSWLNSPLAQDMHPIKYAALAHYKLVFIHPFSDGNGRTARLLMNFLLMQAGYPPVIIRKQDRMMYYDCLQLANQGDTRPFIRFIAHCAEKTLDVYLWATKEMLPKIGQNFDSHSEKKKYDSTSKREGKLEEFADEILSDNIMEEDAELDNTAPHWGLDDNFIGESYRRGHKMNHNEDDLLMEDINNNDYSHKDHMWFEEEEDKGTVHRTDRYSKVLDEEDLFEREVKSG
ncbi:protein adenylyltransferase Fic-like [Macrobrachium nipponense]|uniref:protein adenylyltransferase Fic-like n=1 Tax=Macrobrachium nipponense TaxID=159736 RepID=UPI0030C811E2